MSEVVVLYTEEKDKLKSCLEDLGLSFVLEKHGNGPEHWACQVGQQVLEIYPGQDRIRFLSLNQET